MELANVVAKRGTCTRGYVGAVIAIDGRVISTGYVGAPAGLPHCMDLGCDIGPDGGCQRTVHAEANAIAFAAKHGVPTKGSTLYTLVAPCLSCAKLIINAGITSVIYSRPYRDSGGLGMLGDMARPLR
jgi:dCMP deaminase